MRTSIAILAGVGPLVVCGAVAVLGATLEHSARVPSPSPQPAKLGSPAVAPASPPPVAALPAPRLTPPMPQPRSLSLCAPRLPVDGDEDLSSAGPPLNPARYPAWLRTRTARQRAEIAKHCQANPFNYDRLCGGIGPLHIPPPPCIQTLRRNPPATVPASPHATREEWSAALTRAQRRYIARHCRGEASPSSHLCGLNTPLVIAFDDQPVEFSARGRFAFAPGESTGSDFPSAATPWLALDRDGDGAIGSGAELFGSNTRLADGSIARNGFVALDALDANHDGRIDAEDPAFSSLVLWSDRDADQRSTRDELRAAGDVIVSISLAHRVELRCDARRNCEAERADLVWRDPRGGLHRGAIVDVYLPPR